MQRRIVGNELIVPAVSSWQPKLCAAPGNPPYAYATVADAVEVAWMAEAASESLRRGVPVRIEEVRL